MRFAAEPSGQSPLLAPRKHASARDAVSPGLAIQQPPASRCEVWRRRRLPASFCNSCLRFQAAADGSVPRESIRDDVQLSDPDAFYGMKHALCLNAANHDAARGVGQLLCWSCRVPLSASAAAEEERCAARIKQEDDVLFGTDDMRVERSAQASIHRGVSVHWLIHFTNAHDCWSWPTWRVVENIIKVMLSHFSARCCRPSPVACAAIHGACALPLRPPALHRRRSKSRSGRHLHIPLLGRHVGRSRRRRRQFRRRIRRHAARVVRRLRCETVGGFGHLRHGVC